MLRQILTLFALFTGLAAISGQEEVRAATGDMQQVEAPAQLLSDLGSAVAMVVLADAGEAHKIAILRPIGPAPRNADVPFDPVYIGADRALI